MRPMPTIVRTWRGRASSSNPEGYPSRFRRNVLPELKDIEGFLGALLLKQESGEVIAFVVLTRWASMEAMRAFAGSDVARAVVEPEAVAALVNFDERVQHYEVVEEVTQIAE